VSAPPPAGEVALVLHTHLPYLRGHGTWPVGEEWLFQAWAGSWLPATRMLERLADDGHRDVLTLGVSPMVAHQVRDARLAADVGTWIAGQMWRAEEQRWHHHLDEPVRALSSFHWRRFADLLALHEDVQHRGGLTAVWAQLAADGVIELLGGPATHPYLPLQTDPALVDTQLATGLHDHTTWAGRRPDGLWPPELGYRPRGRVADATAQPVEVDRYGTPTLPRTGPILPGLEEHYAAHGIGHIVVDGPTVIRAAGGADRDWTVRPDVPDVATGSADEVVHDGVLIGDGDVAAYARDLAVAYHVWSPTAGYPGNEWYLDFHARGGFGLHPSWRVTDRTGSIHAKRPYEPEAAHRQVGRDVAHLHGVLRDVLDPRPGGLVVAAFDTELFGHWWAEGPAWLEGLLRRVADDDRLTTTTLRSHRERRPPTRRLALPESSWGYAKGHASWVTDETRPIWVTLRRAEERAKQALRGGTGPDAVREQVARELALLAASDWPFMITRGDAAGYARERVAAHAAHLDELCTWLEDGDEPKGEVADRLAAIRDRDDAPRDVRAIVAALGSPPP
jgi:1,4-alpha-glucan branching enzyme